MGRFQSSYAYLWPRLKAIAARGHRIVVVTSEDLKGKDQVIIEGIEIHSTAHSMSQTIGMTLEDALLEKIEELQSQKPFDILHCTDSTAYYLAEHRSLFKCAFVIDANTTGLDQLFYIFGLTQESIWGYLKSTWQISASFLTSYWRNDRKILRTADGIFCDSTQQQIMLERYFFVPEKKTHVIPLGIEAPELISASRDQQLARELGIPDDAQLVVTVSQMDQVGALKNLITAFERVAIKKPNAYMLILGDGPRFFEVEGHALNYALGNRVFFARDVQPEKLKDFVNLADVFVNIDSRTSGLEPSILQAMLNRKMVIVSEVGSAASVIENGVDGFMVHPTIQSEVSSLILEAFNGQLDLSAIGNAAHKKVLKMFDTRRMVDKTIQAYELILKSARIPNS